jgi:acyl-CoA-binding protein
MVQFEARAKWDAWKEQEGKSKDAAMAEYIAHLDEGILLSLYSSLILYMNLF